MKDGTTVTPKHIVAETAHGPTLIQQASRAAFWNAVLLPVISILNLAFAVVIRQRFGLFSGVYDAVLGLQASLLMYSSLGIPTSLTKFLPEVEERAGPTTVGAFLRRAVVFRLVLLALALVPLNVFAARFAALLSLGDSGPLYIRLVSALVVARALLELAMKTLSAFFEQLRSNVLQLGQAILDFVLVALALMLGYEMGGVLLAIVASSIAMAVVGGSFVGRLLGHLRVPTAAAPGSDRVPDPDLHPDAVRRAVLSEDNRFRRFAFFTFVFEMSIYFAGMGFASTALVVVLGVEQVAVFAAAFKLSFMTVVLVVTGFRGLYRPIFTRLRARGDMGQLQRAFAALSKAQLVLLLPAGIGLAIMCGDYLPLMFGPEFAAATPVARVFAALLFTETAFNLGIIMLSIDERYTAVLATQALLIVAAPLFVIVAQHRGLMAAAAVFGGARVLAALVGYALCHRFYDFRFPWAFGARVAALSGVMGLVVAALRALWPTSYLEAISVTLVGALIFAVGIRVARILGPEEADLLRRSSVPGHKYLLDWFAPEA